MKIYLIHASSYPDFKHNLYQPLISSELTNKHTFVFPHDDKKKPFNSKNTIFTSNLIIAEVSYASLGVGIELGWAECSKRKILCLHREGIDISSSIKEVCTDFVQYTNQEFMVKQIQCWIDKNYSSLLK